jgi:hypothetical protein
LATKLHTLVEVHTVSEERTTSIFRVREMHKKLAKKKAIYTPTKIHGITCHKAVLFIVTTVKVLNSNYVPFFYQGAGINSQFVTLEECSLLSERKYIKSGFKYSSFFPSIMAATTGFQFIIKSNMNNAKQWFSSVGCFTWFFSKSIRTANKQYTVGLYTKHSSTH